jgi:hypothetical protein
MHASVEVVLPPAEPADEDYPINIYTDLRDRLGAIMDTSRNVGPEKGWWDWWVPGGRFSGKKLMARIPEDQLKAFYEELVKRKITVSAVVAGKQTISPASQVPLVDELWRQMMPGQGDVCPLFDHYHDKYIDDHINESDVCLVKDIPERLSTLHVVVADPDNADEAIEVIHKEYWNGKRFKETGFDGNVKKLVTKLMAERPELKIQPNWLVVTCDIHN